MASVAEMERVLAAGVLGGAASALFALIILPASGVVSARIPLGVVGLDVLLGVGAIAGSRFLPRLAWWRAHRRASADGERIFVVGAGQAGQMTVRELHANPQLGLTPVGFIDDDRAKHGHRLMDLPVLGGIADLPRLLQQYAVTQLVIAMPSVPGSVVREVVRIAHESGVGTRTVPGLYEILSGRVGVSNLREVEIQDLLRRAPIRTDLAAVHDLIAERTVLVTGAGGSIGSELCRQIARVDPARLVLLGHGENSIFEIAQELRDDFPRLAMSCIIADVRDESRIGDVFSRVRPDLVFHAAAHKHVPLMEANIVEAVTNNILGTWNVVTAAADAGTPNFVLISSDKAVRPSSVMGATKRAAEQVAQLAARRSALHYVSVRFGNVLGSRGSVVPIFLRQIRAGGPVTITDPEMSRYFMTIPEAVQLVLQAATQGCGGDVFVLDMGEPVRIADLARDLIRLSGLQEGRDIEIRVTGRRPGEKLYEEVFFGGESIVPTSHPKILSARNLEPPPDALERIEALLRAAHRGATDGELLSALHDVVPEFSRPPLEIDVTTRIDTGVERPPRRAASPGSRNGIAS
jgi:FlaA1/EpsC-like NDP-sugar epimerase